MQSLVTKGEYAEFFYDCWSWILVHCSCLANIFTKELSNFSFFFLKSLSPQLPPVYNLCQSCHASVCEREGMWCSFIVSMWTYESNLWPLLAYSCDSVNRCTHTHKHPFSCTIDLQHTPEVNRKGEVAVGLLTSISFFFYNVALGAFSLEEGTSCRCLHTWPRQRT